MENNNTVKSRRKTIAAGTAFALALFAVAVLLFLFSDAGQSFGADISLTQTIYEPTPKPSAETAKTPEPFAAADLSAEEFLARAEEFGASFSASINSENERSIDYMLITETAIGAALNLSLQDGSVRAFMITCDMPVKPEELPPNAGNILAAAHEKRMAQYETNNKWIVDIFVACMMALDADERTTYAAVSLCGSDIRNAVETGNAYETDIGSFAVTFRPDENGGCSIVVRPAEQ
ncbi:MAG: hypothetical protein E7330_08770 [Clostridiales bacterium]|nr:hypothetical protein [Clostridiales bacterium]